VPVEAVLALLAANRSAASVRRDPEAVGVVTSDPFAGRLTLRPTEVAAALGVGKSTVFEWIASGRLASVVLTNAGTAR